MVADAAPAADVLAAADALMTDGQDYLLVAHNAHTEAGLINDYRHACPRLAHTDLLDTVRIARALYPQLGSHKLDNMLAHLDIPQPAGRHRAMPDVKVTAKLFSRMLAHADRTHAWTSLAQVCKSALIISKSNQPKQDSLFTDVEAQR
jgi:DNA polymerase III alpha subunit (gram-positive type)